MEKAHDISLDEPTVAHQAILFMLDILMRNDSQSLTIAELYDSFGDKSFTPQMLRAVGGNEQGLKQFLLRYPSLFTVIGDNISANSGNSMRNSTPERTYIKRNKSKEEDLSQTSLDVDSKTMKEIEQEAIAFFKKQMSKREEDWLPIVSVAGHASQSSQDVRKYVGPQNEFKSFLVRYPHIFVVRDEYCGLKGKADTSTQPFPPPSPPPKRRVLPTTGLTRNQSFKNRYSTCSMSGSMANLSTSISNGLNNTNLSGGGSNTNSTTPQSSSTTNNANASLTKARLTPIEVKAVHYVMRVLHKQGKLLLQTIPGLISRSPEHVSNIVGFTREDLIQFFKRHSAIFQLHPDGCVSVKADAVKALILKDRSFCDTSYFTGNGTVLRIFPKYGILNLDNNEQVFFDIQSCQFETYADLTTILHPSDRLWFNAVIGPRDGSTKWRSLKTWIKLKDSTILGGGDSLSSDGDNKSDNSSDGCNNSIHSLNGSSHSNNHHHHNHHRTIYMQQQQQQQLFTNNINLNANNNFNSNGITSPMSNSNSIYSTNNQLTNSILNIEEELNQYQLDGEYNDVDMQNDSLNNSNSINNTQFQMQKQINDLEDDLNSHLSLSSSNSLPNTFQQPIITSNFNANSTAFVPSSVVATSILQQQQQAQINANAKLINLNANTPPQATMIMKQASDNISKREICSTNSLMVNMGCQTLSTGDIVATNVYIE